MKKIIVILFSIGFFISYGQQHQPANPNANQKTKNILNYLYSLKGTNGGILSGQQSMFWNWEQNRTIAHQDTYINNITQEYPAVYATDYGDFNAADGDHVCSKRKEVVNAVKAYAERGSLISMSYHMSPPEKGLCVSNNEKKANNYPNSLYPYFDEIFEPGGQYYDEMRARLKDVADELEILRDAGITVLWRPYHEMNNATFWWGGAEPENYKKLWNQMFAYFVNERNLHNLLWVWSINYYEQHYSKPQAYYPSGQVDIIGLDAYLIEQGHNYDKIIHDELTELGEGRPLAITENDKMPDAQEFKETQPNYVFWLTWNYSYAADKENTEAFYQKNYSYSKTINLDDFKTVDFDNIDHNEPTEFCLYQAEDFTSVTETVDYVFLEDVNTIEFTPVKVVAAGNYNLTIRYKCASDKNNYVRVNGQANPLDVKFPKSATFTDKTIAVTLNEGDNTIAIEKFWGWMDVDYIKIEGCSTNDEEEEEIAGDLNFKSRYEAEYYIDASIGVSTGNNNWYGDISNNEYVTGLDNDGDKIVFNNIDAPSTGTYLLTIRYAGNSQQMNYVKVNNGDNQSIGFPAAAQFADKTLEINLNEGSNTITLEKQWGWIQVDYIEIESIGADNDDSGSQLISINAKGNCGSETMELLINGSKVDTWQVSSLMDDYNFVYSGETIQTLEVAFVNDDSGSCDRNLFVNNLKIDDTILETETNATRQGCGNEEWLWCNGSFTFNNVN